MTFEDLKNELNKRLNILKILKPSELKNLALETPRPDVNGRLFTPPQLESGFMTHERILDLIDDEVLPKYMESVGDHKIKFAKRVNKIIQEGLMTESDFTGSENYLIGLLFEINYVVSLEEINSLGYRDKNLILEYMNSNEIDLDFFVV
jgi:hypothetical protein